MKTRSVKTSGNLNLAVANQKAAEAPETKPTSAISDHRQSAILQKKFQDSVQAQAQSKQFQVRPHSSLPVLQRLVIQLQKGDNIKPKITKAEQKRDEAVQKFNASAFEGAKLAYTEVRAIVKEVLEAPYIPKSKSEDQSTNGQVDTARLILQGLVVLLKESGTEKLKTLTDTFTECWNTYFPQINSLYDQIADKIELSEDFEELRTTLIKSTKEHHKQTLLINKSLKNYIDFFALDDKLTYKSVGGGDSTLENSKIEPPDFEAVKKIYHANSKLYNSHSEKGRGSLNLPTTFESEELKSQQILKLLSGTPDRQEALAKVVADPANQIKTFKQINQHHRNDPIADVVKLIENQTIEKLDQTLELIKQVGDKGSIAEITDFLSYVPESLSASKFEIVKAFTQKKGASTKEDWSKLLQIEDWNKDQVLKLALAFDLNPGNATADQWALAAAKDPDHKNHPDQVRAVARLDKFAGNDWYDQQTVKEASAGKAQKKYTQLLYALLGEDNLNNLGKFDINSLKGDFLSMLVFFHRHIASFKAEEGHGFDREETGGGMYARSSREHPLNEQLKGMLGLAKPQAKKLLQPLNLSLLTLQGDQDKVSSTKVGGTKYLSKKGEDRFSVSSAGLPSHNLKILSDQQEIAIHNKSQESRLNLFNPKSGIAPGVSRVVGENSSIIDTLIDKKKTGLKDKVAAAGGYESFHDHMLENRGAMVKSISEAINKITGGSEVLNAIGSEGHPSLILLIPKIGLDGPFKYKGTTDHESTKAIVPIVVQDFNEAPGQEVKATLRGSFGFQRPTIADTGDSIRIWPGYAPVEALLPGLKVVVQNIRNKGEHEDLGATKDLEDLKSNPDNPVLHIESLKTAMRHAFIALGTKIDSKAPAPKKRVAEWLKTRLLIKLQQSEILLEKGSTLFAKDSVASQSEKNKHFSVTADMTDKLQEYTMLYTAATLKAGGNPNKEHLTTGKFKNSADVYEDKVVSKLGATDYRIFYLDSGEQALISAGILANRFDKGADESSKNFNELFPADPTRVAKSKYARLNPYFEISAFGGDSRSNLEHVTNGSESVVHADLSPVITSGITAPKPKSEIHNEVRKTWQNEGGDVIHATKIPIIDITNSSMQAVVDLGKMPNNFIIVESLTKHQQLGADKFIMGRLIAVSKTEGSKGMTALEATNFLDLAQKVVGPVANEGYNPLLAQIRANMDRALYRGEM